jgi:hypothetical protein
MPLRLPLRLVALISTLAVTLMIVLGASVTGLAQDFDMEVVERGRVVYDVSAGGVGCAMCHAPFALGDIGPDVRGMSARDISDALGSIPDMAFISLSDADLADLATYLGWLGAHEPVTIRMASGAFRNPELALKTGVPVQLIFQNGDAAEYALTSELWEDAVAVPSRGDAAVVLTPAAAGSFAVACEGCSAGLTINVAD